MREALRPISVPAQHSRDIEDSHVSATEEMPSPQGFDLLKIRWIRSSIRSPLFPYVFQVAMLAVFVFLAIFSWQTYPPTGISDKLFAKSNLVSLLVWGLWWPAMVWAAVLFGRVWCAVCPLELVSNVTERLGRVLGVKQRILGKWLRSGLLVVGLFAIIQLFVPGVHLHRIPAYTSIFLWGLLAMAAFVGFFFKDRAFCRGFCPVGLLLSTYGRGAMLAVRPTSPNNCMACTGKGCVLACNRTRFDARSCPSLLNPAKLNANTDCLVCGQCIKVCQPKSMGLLLRRPFSGADAREAIASWPVTLFVMLVSGFVISELCSEWSRAQSVYLAVPGAVAAWIGPTSQAGWIEGVWTLLVVPLTVWSLLGGLVIALLGAANLGEAWRRLAIPLAVVIAAGHLCKGLAKFVSWIGFLPLALQDPRGTNSALALSAKTNPQPASLLPMSIVSAMAVVLVLTGAYFALREARLANPETYRHFRPALIALAACFIFIVFGWGYFP